MESQDGAVNYFSDVTPLDGFSRSFGQLHEMVSSGGEINIMTTETEQFDTLQEKIRHAEKSVVVIQQKIRQKRVTEAIQIFLETAPILKPVDLKRITKQLSDLVEQAEKYFHEADTLETKRKLEQARKKYKKVEEIAIDYPGLSEAFNRIDDALTLIRALKHRAQRRAERQKKQPVIYPVTSQPVPSRSKQFREWIPLLACLSLLLVLVGAGLFYRDNLHATFFQTKKDKTLQVEQLKQNESVALQNLADLSVNNEIGQPEGQKQRKKQLL